MKKLVILAIACVFIGAGCAPEPEAPEVATPDVPELNLEDLVEENMPEENTDPAEEETTEPTNAYTFPGVLTDEEIKGKQIRLTTEKGDIVFELYADASPKTVSNFVYLTSEGYYNGLKFHRREEGFVIQGGDPKGNGTGGPGYKFEDELEDEYKYDHGIVAMANSGPNTNGSQFFIMLSDYPLPKAYSIFGKVTEGLDIVDQIQVGDVMTEVVVEDKE